MPSLFDEDIHFTWLPDSNTNSDLSFSQRIKKGFAMAMSGGVDFFFGIGSVANYITESFGKSSGGGHSGMRVSPGNAVRYLRAKYISRRDGRPITPGDIFRLKAFFFAGTDAKCYKDRLTRAWGIAPVELAAGYRAYLHRRGDLGAPGHGVLPGRLLLRVHPRAGDAP